MTESRYFIGIQLRRRVRCSPNGLPIIPTVKAIVSCPRSAPEGRGPGLYAGTLSNNFRWPQNHSRAQPQPILSLHDVKLNGVPLGRRTCQTHVFVNITKITAFLLWVKHRARDHGSHSVNLTPELTVLETKVRHLSEYRESDLGHLEDVQFFDPLPRNPGVHCFP